MIITKTKDLRVGRVCCTKIEVKDRFLVSNANRLPEGSMVAILPIYYGHLHNSPQLSYDNLSGGDCDYVGTVVVPQMNTGASKKLEGELIHINLAHLYPTDKMFVNWSALDEKVLLNIAQQIGLSRTYASFIIAKHNKKELVKLLHPSYRRPKYRIFKSVCSECDNLTFSVGTNVNGNKCKKCGGKLNAHRP